MKEQAEARITELVTRYPSLSSLAGALCESAERLIRCYRTGHKIMACRNGGSAADALHIVGELMKAFVCKRAIPEEWQEKFAKLPDGAYMSRNLQMALPAISLVSETGLLTAYANDVAPDMNFAQQVSCALCLCPYPDWCRRLSSVQCRLHQMLPLCQIWHYHRFSTVSSAPQPRPIPHL